MKKFVFGSFFIFLASTLLVNCGKMKEPQFKGLENFEVKKMGLQNAVVGFDATFFNPNRFGLNVKEAALDIYLDSLYLGKFTQPQDVAVTSGANFSIPLEGTLTWQQVLKSEWKDLVGKEILFKANGLVKVGKAGVFVTKNIAYQGRHKLDMDLIKNPAGAGF
jgi:LEA14-like dessication related protein